LTENTRTILHGHREDLLSAVSAGFFLVLVGMLFVTTPGLFDNIVAFFQDFNLIQVPHLQGVLFPGPQNPRSADAMAVYNAVEWFSLIWAIFLTAMLVARFLLSQPRRRKSDNLGDIVFWFGTAYITQNLLIDVNTTEWFGFWAAIIILIGLSLIARAIYLAIVGIIPKR
jgi:hypothetical protein